MTTREAALAKAAQDFIDKVDRGEARSVTSYAAFKAALALTASAPKGEIWGWYEPIVPELGGSLVERYRKGSEKPLGWSKHAVPLYTSAPPAPGWDELEPVLSFLDELAANAASGKRESLNPILIGGSAKLYAEGLREALRREAPASSGVEVAGIDAAAEYLVQTVKRTLWGSLRKDGRARDGGFEPFPHNPRQEDYRDVVREIVRLAAPPRPDAGCVREALTYYKREWVRQITNQIADKETAAKIVELAELNGLFDLVKSAISNPTDASNASAEARLREALDCTRRALVVLRVRLSTEPTVQGRSWIDLGIMLNNAVDKADNALSPAAGVEAKKSEGGKEPRGCPTPGACSCPSDPTADVTVGEIRAFLDTQWPAPHWDVARALLDAFTVGRR